MRRSSVGVSNIQKWFFSEKAFREQLRSWGWIYLFFASFSLLTGLISFGVTLRWFPISDMLRALLLDSLLTLPVMFLPGMLATGVLVLSFVPFLRRPYRMSCIFCCIMLLYRRSRSSPSLRRPLMKQGNLPQTFFLFPMRSFSWSFL